jgi:hypothetical protein
VVLTLQKIRDINLGNAKGAIYAYTADASYPATGYGITPGTLNVVNILQVDPHGAGIDTVAGRVYETTFDYNAKTLRFWNTPLLEVTTGFSLANVSGRVTILSY